MKTFARNIICVIVLLLSLFAFTYHPEISLASDANFSYSFLCQFTSKSDGKFTKTMILNIELDRLGLTNQEKEIFSNRLSLMMQSLLNDELFLLSQAAIEHDGVLKDGNKFSYEIQYPSYGEYNNHNTGTAQSVYNKKFISQAILTFENPFTSTVQQDLKQKIAICATGLSLEGKTDLLVGNHFGVFSTFNNYTKSDAEEIATTNGGKLHLWNLNQPSRIMKLTLTRPVAGWWYLIALTLPLGLCGMSILVIVIVEHFKKNTKQKILK